jgi:hypothetical protein
MRQPLQTEVLNFEGSELASWPARLRALAWLVPQYFACLMRALGFRTFYADMLLQFMAVK